MLELLLYVVVATALVVGGYILGRHVARRKLKGMSSAEIAEELQLDVRKLFKK